LLIISAAPVTYSADRETLFRDEFVDIDNWRLFSFKDIDRHTSYTIEKKLGASYLTAESRASASALVLRRTFNVYEYPRATWRWKAENTYEKGDAGKKSGDDYPLRIYIVLQYDPSRAGYLEKMKYEAAKLLYGEYPPHSSLNYIWANREHSEGVLTSTYTERSKMLPLQGGVRNLGTWQIEDVNIVNDYRMAFGTDPPPTASIGIMNDSDNTGEGSISYLDYIEVYRQKGME
jgi:hypothetical protein